MQIRNQSRIRKEVVYRGNMAGKENQEKLKGINQRTFDLSKKFYKSHLDDTEQHNYDRNGK